MSYRATDNLHVHRLDADFYYVDFGPILRGRTISAIATLTGTSQSGGTDPTVASQAVLTVNTPVYVTETDTRTIEANTGVKFKLSALTTGAKYLVVVSVTLSDGNVLGLDAYLYADQ